MKDVHCFKHMTPQPIDKIQINCITDFMAKSGKMVSITPEVREHKMSWDLGKEAFWVDRH